MTPKKFSTQRLIQIISFLLFILTPLISAILFCLKDGKSINDIYIPLGGWSDEITYYKQIEGILSHGMPHGYFGYNQSRALYGPLAVWGLPPLIPYIIWGGFFGWNYCSPIYANIFFGTLALTGVYFILRPQKRTMGIISLFWLCNQFLNRYVCSGVIEISVMMHLMLVMSLGEYLLSDQIRTQTNRSFTPAKDRIAMIFCTVLISFMTLGRPYFAVLYLIPLWKALRERQKKWMILLPFVALGTLALFFLNNHYFCSTYFSNVLSLEGIIEGGISSFLLQIINSLIDIIKVIWYAIRYPGSGIGWYYLQLGLELLVMLCTCIICKIKKHKMPPLYISTLIGNCLILLSIIILYDLGVGARHFLALIVVNAVLLLFEGHWCWDVALAAICLFSIYRTGGADALPYQNDAYVAYMNELETDFANVIQVTDVLSYDNVVAMPTADHVASNPDMSVCTYYGIMFALPSGMGISLDFEDFYENPENLKAGYFLVHPDGQIRQTLEKMGMKCIYEREELMLYQR